MNKNTYIYESLALDDSISIDNYKIPLLEAIEREYIYNIAITGSYGAGKSSFIKAFEKDICSNKDKNNKCETKYKFINISLTNFSDKPNLENLEQEILKQIIYTTSYSETPLSRFKKINDISMKERIIKSSFYLLVFVSAIYLKINFNTFISGNITLFSWFFLSIFLTFLYLLVSDIIKYQPFSKITKLVVKDYEVELSSDEKLVFNKYIDEIIYYFNATKANIVIFEDLDRFTDTNIFSRLRELNLLINKKNKNKKIIFIYALRDEHFKCSEQRTKFFDFILPIIPVVNSFNAGSKFAEIMKGELIDENILFELGIFINNIRELKNVKNEYLVYKKTLNLHIDHNKNILAMMILKNKYPKEFEDLQSNEGLIYQIFQSKKDLIDRLNKNIVASIEKHNEEIKQLDKEISDEKLKSIEELNLLYINKIFEYYPNTRGFNIGGTYNHIGNSIKIMKNDETFLKIFEGASKIIIMDINSNNESNPRLWDDSLKKEYYRRRDILIKEVDSKKYRLFDEIKILENEKSKNDKLTVSEILENYEEQYRNLDKTEIPKPMWQEIMEKLNLKENILLKFLLQNVLIEEDSYPLYYSYVIEGLYTNNDIQYVLGLVINGNNYNPDYKIDKPETISNRFKHNMKKNFILNYCIAEYLSKCSNELLEDFALALSKNQNCFDFLTGFYNVMSKQNSVDTIYKNLILKVLRIYDNFFVDLPKTQINPSEFDYILSLILNTLSTNDIKRLNNLDILRNYFEIHPNLLQIVKIIDFDNVKKNLQELEPKIKDISNFYGLNKTEYNLLNFIYENSYYEINIDNIKSIYNYYTSDITNDFDYKSYTMIMSKLEKVGKLCDYINDNINIFFASVHSKLDSNQEDIEFIIKLLKDKSLELRYKEILIEKNVFILSTIEDDYKNCWMSIFKHFRISPTWTNINKYFKYAEQIDEALITFINAKQKEISIDINFPEASEFKLLLDSILKKESIFLDILCNNIQKHILDSIVLTEVSKERISHVIEKEILEFNKDNYDEIFKADITLLLKFIKKNEDIFIDGSLFLIEFSDNEIINILSSKDFSNEFKVKFLEQIKVKEIENTNIMEQIWLLTSELNEISFDMGILNKLMEYLKDTNKKIELICNLDWNYAKDYIWDLFYSLGKPYSLLKTQDKATFNYSDNDMILFENLERRGMIEFFIIRKNKHIHVNCLPYT